MSRAVLGSIAAILLFLPAPAGAQQPATPVGGERASVSAGSLVRRPAGLRIPLRTVSIFGDIQGAAVPRRRVSLPGRTPPGGTVGAGSPQEATGAVAGPGPATSFLSSLILPGSAQWMQGQDRTYVYLGLEVLGWIGFLHERHRGADYRNGYRDLARTYALLTEDESGSPGGFGYYETLGQYVASGAWDADPAEEGLQPEMDPDTYNGTVWSLAADLYLSGEGQTEDPEAVRKALLYYQERAYPPEHAWDWSGNSEQMSRYGDLIERSDESFRRSTVILGAVVANHLLSAVDGFLSSRLSSDRTLRLSSDVRPDRGPGATSGRLLWSLQLRVNAVP